MTTGTGLAPVKGAGRFMAADPFRELRERMNRMFERPFGWLALPGEESWSLAVWSPICDIYETDNEIVVKAELPGLKKEDVKVDIEDNLLTIKGERKFEKEVKREDYHRLERSYGEFTRSFTLPATVDAGKIDADFKDGLLRVTLPKREESKRKAIEVKVK